MSRTKVLPIPIPVLGRHAVNAYLLLGRRPGRTEPDVLISAATSLEDFGVAGRVMPTPGHTAGSVSGDLVANSFMGLIPGKPADPPFHDDPVGNFASLQAMLDLNPTALHVGHCIALRPDRVRPWVRREHHRPARLEAAVHFTTRAEGRP